MPDFVDLQPTLRGPHLTLRPLLAGDFEAMYHAASDPKIWEQHPNSNRHERAVFMDFFNEALASLGAFAVIDNASGCIVGSTRFYEWNAHEAEIAIGYTFLARSHWGGAANAEMKALLLAHAFGFARRVWFHVGVQNWRSRRAMEKVGGVFSHQARKEGAPSSAEYVYYKIERPRQVQKQPGTL